MSSYIGMSAPARMITCAAHASGGLHDFEAHRGSRTQGGMRNAGDPRGAASRPDDGRGDAAYLSGLDLPPARTRNGMEVRLRAHDQPDAWSAGEQPRRA